MVAHYDEGVPVDSLATATISPFRDQLPQSFILIAYHSYNQIINYNIILSNKVSYIYWIFMSVEYTKTPSIFLLSFPGIFSQIPPF